MEIPSFGDFVKNRPLEGDKIKIDDVLGKPVVVTGCAVTKSKYTNKGSGFLTRIQIYFEDDEEQKRHVIFYRLGSHQEPDRRNNGEARG